MNYRHAFHAGNFADVFKHVLLTRMLLYLGRKPAPFRYLDTHSGIGLYDLHGEDARRGAEWQDGIGRIDPAAMPEPVHALMAPYLDIVGPRDRDGRPSLYPGSPMLAMGLSRPGDRLTLCELHPADADRLRVNLGKTGRAKVVTIDGYAALNAYVPPPERRGLVLIDPPFELRTEFQSMVEGLRAAHRKWPTGIYALWYPLKDQDGVTRFTRDLVATGLKRVAQVDLVVDGAALRSGHLGGCGMILVNPPYSIEEEARVLLMFLSRCLGRSEPGSWTWRWLSGE
jgi:23S rRNA (adenine2030-N6)-methyltransferase